MEPVVLKFTESTQFSDDELFDFCVANKELRIERDKYGQIIVMPPTGAITGNKNFTLNTIFGNWVMANRHLGYGFDSSTGFKLPNGAMRSPNSAWIKKERWEQLSVEQQEKFAPLTPDFLIEVRSKTDTLQELQAKLNEWIENGCCLAWLIDPLEQRAYIYKPNESAIKLDNFNSKLNGENILPGFELDLSLLK